MEKVDKKKELLYQSFEILKDDVLKNINKLSELIGKMSKLDINVATDMWNYLLKENQMYVEHSESAYKFCGGIVYDISRASGEGVVKQIVKQNPFIMKNIFEISGDVCISTYIIISDSLKQRDLEFADNALTQVFNNKNKEQSFEEVLEKICEYISIDEESDNTEIIALLMKWFENVSDSERKARIMVSLVDYL